MSERILHPQWRDELAASRYPFSDAATLVASTGISLLPDVFLDAKLYPASAKSPLYISVINVTGAQITIFIGDIYDEQMCTTTFNTLTPPSTLRVLDKNGRSAGVLVSDSLRLASFQGWASGNHVFGQAAAEFVASVVSPMPAAGVRALRDVAQSIASGDVWLIGENGVALLVDDDGPAPLISVNAIGESLFLRAACLGKSAKFEPKIHLKTINGLPPNAAGNFIITTSSLAEPDNILRVTPTDTGLLFAVAGPLGGNA